jgi:hypothetical protein
MRTFRFSLLLLLTLPLFAQSPPAAKPVSPWAPFEFLLGDWVGEGTGTPGQGGGGFSFHPELEGKILVRRNVADYPATKERPAAHHEDLMTVYIEGGAYKADYFDNEGHVIHYGVTPAGASLVFLSEPGPGPRFRLTYSKTGPQTARLKFEIASPDMPDVFKSYIEATVRRTAK